MRRRNYRYRPNKVQSIVGIAAGALFILIGIIEVIPSAGLFGVVWTLFAAGITVAQIYAVASGKGYGSWEMEEEGSVQLQQGEVMDFEEKLQKLQRLYDQRLITRDEYDKKRAEIMDEKW
mgnify:FL=1